MKTFSLMNDILDNSFYQIFNALMYVLYTHNLCNSYFLLTIVKHTFISLALTCSWKHRRKTIYLFFEIYNV